MGHSPCHGVQSLQLGGAHFTLDTDAELAAGSVVCLVMGSVANHMLSFREFGAGLWAPQHHPAPSRQVYQSEALEGALSVAYSPH